MVIRKVMDIPRQYSPDLVDKAECIIVFPPPQSCLCNRRYLRRGSMTCRSGEHFTGPWSAPTMMALEAQHWLSTRRQATDFVLLVMIPVVPALFSSNKVKLGADGSAAAGPKGPPPMHLTDVSLRAEVLSYSRAEPLCGLSLKVRRFARTTTPMNAFMAKKIDQNFSIVFGCCRRSPAAQKMIAYLNQKSENLSDPESLK